MMVIYNRLVVNATLSGHPSQKKNCVDLTSLSNIPSSYFFLFTSIISELVLVIYTIGLLFLRLETTRDYGWLDILFFFFCLEEQFTFSSLIQFRI